VLNVRNIEFIQDNKKDKYVQIKLGCREWRIYFVREGKRRAGHREKDPGKRK